MPTDGPTTKCYPTEEQYERWKENAEESGMSIGEFIASMVEAGHKTFTVTVEPDETNHELRQELDRLRQLVEDARDEINSLEKSIHRSEAVAIEAYIRENPGCTWGKIVDAVKEGAKDRVTDQLVILEGRTFRRVDGAFYPIDEVP